MEANVMVQANMAPNLNPRQPAPESAVNRPAPAPVISPAPVAPAPPVPDMSSATGINILSAHPSVSPGATEELITLDVPLPFGDTEITESVIARYVANVNQALAPSFFRLNFNIHEDTNRVMVKVIDTNTDEVLREIPPESRLDIIARMQEFAGLLFDERS